MGTVCERKPANVKQFLIDSWTQDGSVSPSRTNYRVLDCKIVGIRTAYMAVEKIDHEGIRSVFGAVTLLTYMNRTSLYDFCHKEMDETMGPVESKAPASILDLLTPTDNEYANKWRARCRENIEKGPNRWLAIRLGNPGAPIVQEYAKSRACQIRARKLAREQAEPVFITSVDGRVWQMGMFGLRKYREAVTA